MHGLLSSLRGPSPLPTTFSHETQPSGAHSMEHAKPRWAQENFSSGVAQARHFGLAPKLGGYSATKLWSTASSISSSSSSSTSSSTATSPRPTSGATLAAFVGLNQRLEAPSPIGTHSRYFPSLVKRSSSLVEEGPDSNSSPVSSSPIKLPWFFPASNPPVVKKGMVRSVACRFDCVSSN